MREEGASGGLDQMAGAGSVSAAPGGGRSSARLGDDLDAAPRSARPGPMVRQARRSCAPGVNEMSGPPSLQGVVRQRTARKRQKNVNAKEDISLTPRRRR